MQRTTRLTLFIFLASSLSVVQHVLADSHQSPEESAGSKSSEEVAAAAAVAMEGDQKLSPAEILAAKGDLYLL